MAKWGVVNSEYGVSEIGAAELSAYGGVRWNIIFDAWEHGYVHVV